MKMTKQSPQMRDSRGWMGAVESAFNHDGKTRFYGT